MFGTQMYDTVKIHKNVKCDICGAFMHMTQVPLDYSKVHGNGDGRMLGVTKCQSCWDKSRQANDVVIGIVDSDMYVVMEDHCDRCRAKVREVCITVDEAQHYKSMLPLILCPLCACTR